MQSYSHLKHNMRYLMCGIMNKFNYPIMDKFFGHTLKHKKIAFLALFLLASFMLFTILDIGGITGLTIFTSTIEKAKEYGVLKAIGVKNNQLYQMVLGQAFVAGLIGYSLGVILAFAVNQIVTRLVPEFISLFRLVDFILVLGATLIMSLLAAYIPIRRIAVINPAEVFKA